LAEIAGCVIISAAVLSSMIDHILSYLTSNGMCRAPENYLLINNRYIKKVINTRKPAQRKRDECRKINKNRILYLKSILREGCRVKGFLW
jgi:hypothetical protein